MLPTHLSRRETLPGRLALERMMVARIEVSLPSCVPHQKSPAVLAPAPSSGCPDRRGDVPANDPRE